MIGSKDSYSLITGASSGMGYEYAKLFAKDGKNVVVVARSGDKLEGLKKDLERAHGTKVKILVKDLSDPKSPLEIFSELGREGINVDVLVNNAGFAVGGKFSDSDWQKETEMLQVNIISLTQLTKLFLKGMLDKKSGKILNISSLAGFTPSSGASVYGGTKHYVLGFSNAIADELRRSGVSVTCFCPTATKTPFWKRADAEDCKALKSGALVMDAATAARHGYKALAKGKTTAAPGLMASFVMFSSRLMPRKVATRMFGQLLEPA